MGKRFLYRSRALQVSESTEEQCSSGSITSKLDAQPDGLEACLKHEQEEHAKTRAYLRIVMAEAARTQSDLDQAKRDLYIERWKLERASKAPKL